MTPVEVLAVVAVGGVVTAVAKRSGKTGRRKSGPRRSWLVTMYNNAGATPVTSPNAKDTAAEVLGRAVGAATRGGKNHTGRAANAVRTAASRGRDRLADRAAPRWEARLAARPAETIVDRWKQRRASAGPRRKMRFHRPDLRRFADRLKPKPKPEPSPSQPDDIAVSVEPSVPAPAPPPPAPPSGVPMPVTDHEIAATADAAPIAVPSDWAALIARVTDFTPENDVDLIDFMKGETAGVLGYAEGVDAARETCITVVGLDPSSVSGITAYSEHIAEASARMSEALNTFRTVYAEVLQLRASGVVLPYDGRWMTGGGADA